MKLRRHQQALLSISFLFLLGGGLLLIPQFESQYSASLIEQTPGGELLSITTSDVPEITTSTGTLLVSTGMLLEEEDTNTKSASAENIEEEIPESTTEEIFNAIVELEERSVQTFELSEPVSRGSQSFEALPTMPSTGSSLWVLALVSMFGASVLRLKK